MESVPKNQRIERRCSRQAIPDDLISEVLVRLPVKSLLRFRCVSRTWRSLISDPYLILSHRCRSQQRPFVLVKEWNLYDGDNDRKATYALTSEATLLRTYYDFIGVNRISDTTIRVFSSSPDLICIHEDGSRCTLLNLAIRERVTLPEFSSGNTIFFRYVGFGYVPSPRKFKAARFFGREDIDHGSGRQVVEERCAVLTVGVDRSWRPAGGPPFMITGDPMAFVNGALHMTLTTSTEEGSGLAALDLETEAWRVISMPRGVGTYSNIRMREQRGLLFLDHFPGTGKVEVWAMKDYEKGGWEMEHRIDLERLQMPRECGMFLPREFDMFLPMVIGEDGRILIFIDWRALLWYDPRDQKVAPFSPHGGHSLVRPSRLVQVENYLPLNGWD